jgi:hypothetical protein
VYKRQLYGFADAQSQILDATITFGFFTAGSAAGGDPDFGDLAVFTGT